MGEKYHSVKKCQTKVPDTFYQHSRVLNARRLAHKPAPIDAMRFGAGKFRPGSLSTVSKGLTVIGVAIDSYSAYDAFSNGDYGNGYFHSVSAVAGLFPPTAIVAGTANLIKMGIERNQRNFENAVDRTNTQAALLWVRMNQKKAENQAIGMMERIEGNDMELLKCLEDCECRK